MCAWSAMEDRPLRWMQWHRTRRDAVQITSGEGCSHVCMECYGRPPSALDAVAWDTQRCSTDNKWRGV